MLKLGLDFGTTNSTLCYFDQESGVAEPFWLGGKNVGSPYIPSFVAVEREDTSSIYIGAQARLKQGDEDYDVYSRFKMLLGEDDPVKIEEHGYISKTPVEVTSIFLQSLLDSYCRESVLRQEIEKIVITVPEIWVNEGRSGHAAKERLRAVCQELKLPVKRLISEPVAASAYFVDRYFAREKRWFDGHVLVCDYGGGTLDLSLSKISGQKITVLERTGKGHDKDFLGKAGVAYDEAVVSKVFEQITEQKLSKTNPKYNALLVQFENNKIMQKDDLSKKLKQHLEKTTVNKKVFSIDSMAFMASDLLEAYERVIASDLQEALVEMQGYFSVHGVDTQDRDHFRVVMVGGFSSFFLVQQTVRKFFGSETLEDTRFDTCFDLTDTALAISKGACLVANDKVDIDPTCPMSVGLRVFDRFCTPEDIPILSKGEKISRYSEPQYARGGIELALDPRLKTVPMIVFLGDGKKRKYLKLDQAVDRLLPNPHLDDNEWRIGFSVTDDYIFTLHAVDSNGEKKDTLLGDLMERVAGVFYSEERA